MRYIFRLSTLFLGFVLYTQPLHAAEVTETEPILITPSSTPITTKGKNRQPLFVDEDSILFVSSQRTYHQDPQLYFKDLKTGREKRITHQRGHITNGFWMNKDQKIFFSSSTDEDKETPLALKKYMERFPSSVDSHFFFHLNLSPAEIYSSHVDGSNIERLSTHMGYDAFPAYLPNKKQLLFSRFEDGKVNIFAKSLQKNLKPWKVMQTSGNDFGLQLSPKEDQFIWSRFSPDYKSAQIMLSNSDFKNPQFLTLDSGISWSPHWHPNNETILYSAKRSSSKNYDLYEVSIKEGCSRQITSYEGDEFYPAVSPDGKKLLFTSTEAGTEQIHQIKYPEPFQCDTL